MNEYGRESQSYQYLDDKFQVVTYTSIPTTDEEALDHFRIIALQYNVDVTYVTARGFGATDKYKMLPFKYDRVTGEVTPLE